MRTLIDNDKRTERRTAVVAEELKRYNIDIAALSETRLSGEDQLEETGSGYTFFWSGKPDGERRDAGVGFAIRNKLLDKIEQPTAINERITRLRIPLANGRFTSVISIYAPTLVSCEDEIVAFYTALSSLLNTIPKEEGIILLGDFNARVGVDFDTWKPLGHFGIGKMNNNGLLLLQLCTQFDLAITNTFFRQNPVHKATWFHPRSKHGHMIDFIITRRRNLRDFCKVRVMRGANCDTDHMMVRAKLKMCIRKKVRSSGVKVPKRIDISKLSSPDAKASLTQAYNSHDFTDCTWDEFKDTVYQKGVEVLGLRKTRRRDWFADNSLQINQLLEKKRAALVQKLNANPENEVSLTTAYKDVRRHVQMRIRQIKNQWWTDLAAEIETARNNNDTRLVHSLIRQAYGPNSPTSVPMLSKDGLTTSKTSEDILLRWTEHFTDLFLNPSVVDFDALNSLPQHDLHPSLLREPTAEEIQACLKQLNTGKAPGLDGIPVELLLHGGENLLNALKHLILCVWSDKPMPQDWIDAVLVILYKGKGKKSLCGSYRGITLLEAVGKVFARLMLNRLNEAVSPNVLPEAQCGFRPGRGTVDMIFAARQLMEKCTEQRMPLYQVFVDLTKAFDTVNREALWIVLSKFGCPTAFVDKFKNLHGSMKAQVNFNGKLSEKFAVDNGVKQGDIPAPTLFSIYLAALLWYAFHDCDKGVHIRFRTTGGIFNLRRMHAKSLVSDELIRELLYADDADLVAHSLTDIQEIMDRFADACTKFGLTISLGKTKVMYTPAPGDPYVEPDIYVHGTRLEVVESFIYLGSSLSDDGSLDSEIKQRIAKASSSFGRLRERVWADKNLTINTKLAVFESCVMGTLLYASETWTTYRRHVQALNRFHQQCLRQILGIEWQSRTPDTDVLAMCGSPTIGARLMKNQMRWAGHLARMQDCRLPKQLFFGELSNGSRARHGQKKRFRDVIRVNLSHMKLGVKDFESACGDRGKWRSLVHCGAKSFEEGVIAQAKLKRACRKRGDVPATPWVCSTCERVLLTKAALVNHCKSHQPRQGIQLTVPSLPPAPTNVCPVCSKSCRSAGGLKLHMKKHGEAATPSPALLPNQCHLCKKICKTLSGLQSHLRAHERRMNEDEYNNNVAAIFNL